MNSLAKASLLFGFAAAASYAGANYTIYGEISPNVQITSSTLIFMMDGCYHFNYGTPNPRAFAAGSVSSFISDIDGGVSTANDISDKRYAFFATYTRQDGSSGIAVSMNPIVAGSIIGNKTSDDIFNNDGYGVSESELMEAISNAASNDYDIYQPARYKIVDCFLRLNSWWQNDIQGTSQLDQDSVLVCFSTASYGGTIRSTAGQPVPGPGAGIAMAIGIGTVCRKRRQR